jgi:hypothetical protein
MAKNDDDGSGQPVAGTLLPAKTPPPRYRCKLDTAGDIEREMKRVYRQARSGALAVGEACRLAYLLATLGKLREAGTVEERLAALEHAAANPQRLADP